MGICVRPILIDGEGGFSRAVVIADFISADDGKRDGRRVGICRRCIRIPEWRRWILRRTAVNVEIVSVAKLRGVPVAIGYGGYLARGVVTELRCHVRRSADQTSE